MAGVSTESLIADLLELASIPAPTFAEGARIDWLERRLAGASGSRYRDSVGNLIWRWGEGRPRLVVAAHVDTVFPEGTELRFERDGPWLVGPGIGDNAAAVVVAIQVGERFLGGAMLPAAVVFTVGEEGLGNLRGARAACEELRPGVFVALEGHGLEHVIVDAVGSIRARVRVTGPGGHSWVDRGRPSAIHALLDLGVGLTGEDETGSPVNVGVISGGRSVNAIADTAEFLVEQRSLDEASLEQFSERLEAVRVAAPLSVTTEIVGRRPAGRLDRSDPLLGIVREVRQELGLPEALGEGSTDANAALALDIPALTLGVAYGSGMHTLEERIDAGSIATGCDQLAAVLERLLVA